MIYYYRFCATIHYFFDRVLKLSDPSIYSILFVSFLQGVYLFGVYYSICLILGARIFLVSNYVYAFFFAIVIANYFIVYRREKQYEYSTKMLHPFLAISVIIVGYVFMGVSGSIFREYFFGK